MTYRPQYFDLEELVCPHTFERFGFVCWQFFDEKLLITIDWLRKSLNKPIYVNSWQIGGSYSQRGFRCIQCPLVKSAYTQGRVYVSPHMTGQGVDFDVKGMTATEVRLWLGKNEDRLLFPIRLEKSVSWVHLDIRDNFEGRKITYFNP